MLTKCSDCGGNLEEGVMMDFTYGGVAVQRHAKASVPKEMTLNMMSETKFEDIRRVVSYRCIKCNRIFPYAQDLVLGKNLWQSQKKNVMYGLFFGMLIVVLVFLMVFVLGGFR